MHTHAYIRNCDLCASVECDVPCVLFAGPPCLYLWPVIRYDIYAAFSGDGFEIGIFQRLPHLHAGAFPLAHTCECKGRLRHARRLQSAGHL